MNISHTTVQNVLEKDLKCYPYKKVKQQLLSGPTHKKRLKRARLLLHHLQDCMQPPVLWTNEKLFTVQAIHNAQNDRVWARNVKDIPKEHRISFRHQKPASVMVWAGITSSGLKTPLIFIEEGVKINQHVYLGLLRDQVVSWVQSTIGDGGLTLQRRSGLPQCQNGLELLQRAFQRILAKGPLASFFSESQTNGLWNLVHLGAEGMHDNS